MTIHGALVPFSLILELDTMANSRPPSHKHLRKAAQSFQDSDLNYRVISKLIEALEVRFDDREIRMQRYSIQLLSDLRSMLEPLVADWPEELRKFLFANLHRLFFQLFSQLQQQMGAQQIPQQEMTPQQKKALREQQQQQQQLQMQQQSGYEILSRIYSILKTQEQPAKEQRDQEHRDLEVIEQLVGSLNEIDEEIEAQREKEERVNFSVYGPSLVAVDDPFILDLWAYLDPQQKHVANMVARMQQVVAGTKKHTKVKRQSVLVVQLKVPALQIEKDTQMLEWEGHETFRSFHCRLKRSEDMYYGMEIPGEVIVQSNGLQLASIEFKLNVAEKTEEVRGAVSTKVTQPSTAFASYASEDRIEVLRSVEGLTKGAPQMDVFVDVISLRAGQDWEKLLQAYIRKSEIFYLFWSSAALRSKWVDYEWKYALKVHGISSIDPFPLERPEMAPPPQELKSLHFNSKYQMFIDAEKYLQAMKA